MVMTRSGARGRGRQPFQQAAGLCLDLRMRPAQRVEADQQRVQRRHGRVEPRQRQRVEGRRQRQRVAVGQRRVWQALDQQRGLAEGQVAHR